MEAEEADRLRRRWGDRPCLHEKFERESHLGIPTGFEACVRCGHVVWPSDRSRPPNEATPVRDSSGVTSTAPRSVPTPGPAPPRKPSRRTPSAPLILIVDDQEDARAIYGLSLQQGGFRIALAKDGVEALAAADECFPDLVLLDLVMPQMDGWEVARRLRANRRTKEIPVIALTAHSGESHRARALEAGCDMVLSKPCQPDALVARVRSQLERRH